MRTHRIIALLLCATLWAPRAAASSPMADSLALRADDAYRAEDYPQAIALYEEALGQGMTSATLHYNLAGAYYREQRLGPAILNYERALRLRPGMADARQNLALATDHTTDRITQLPVLFVAAWWQWLATHILPPAWRVVVLALMALMGVAVVLFLAGRSRRLRRVGFGSLLGLIPLTIVALALLFSSTHRFNAHSHAIILEPVAELKNSPEATSVTRMQLHEGTKVRIDESLPGWHRVHLADGTVGWIRAELVERI